MQAALSHKGGFGWETPRRLHLTRWKGVRYKILLWAHEASCCGMRLQYLRDTKRRADC